MFGHKRKHFFGEYEITCGKGILWEWRSLCIGYFHL